MKILNRDQIKAADLETIAVQSITSLELMERAAAACFKWMESQVFIDQQVIRVFCGMGNNGGDGLALARLLNEALYDVEVYIVHFSNKMSDDFIANYNRLEEFDIYPKSIHSVDDFPELSDGDIVIDAIFGTGLSKAPYGFTKSLIQYFNISNRFIVSIDTPSGLFADKPIVDEDAVVKADVVLSFQLPKLTFLLPNFANYVNEFILLDIGLDLDFIDNLPSIYHYTEQFDLMSLYGKRTKFSHKGMCGHTLIIGGSYGKMGSVLMASKAAYKAGCGYVTSYIPKCGYNIMQLGLPDALVEVDQEDYLTQFTPRAKVDAIAIGVGMGVDPQTVEGFSQFIANNTLPIVIDADALNILSTNKTLYQYLNQTTILTPHPKELQRLIGTWRDDFEKLDKLRVFSQKYGCIVVLKGAHTVVACRGEFYFNSSGNQALAQAGTGDVLTGLIASYLAQGYAPLTAARLGVYLHGLCADVYVSANVPESLLASELMSYMPEALKQFIFPIDKSDLEDIDFLDEEDYPEGDDD